MTIQEERDRIVHAARNRFLGSGISKVTLDEIAGDLGMSKKTIYKFFSGKDVLLKAVVKFMIGFIERNVAAIVESNKPFEKKMTELLSFVGGNMSTISREFQRDLQRFAPKLWTEIETFRREHILSKIETMFLQAKAEGVFRKDLNHEVFMLMFLKAVEGIMNSQTLSQHSFNPETAFRSIFKILFEGALTDGARKQFQLFEPSYSHHISR